MKSSGRAPTLQTIMPQKKSAYGPTKRDYIM